MKTRILLGGVAATAMLLTGCGGGGSTTAATSGGSSTSSTTTASSTTISGTAATGAPFAGATVSIIDKTGTVVGSGTTGTDGSYTITLSAGAAAPFVLQAVRDDMTLVSVAADTTTTTFNITPITNLIASRLSTSGDPTRLAAELTANPSLLSNANVTARVNEIITLIKPLLDTVGTTANPLNDKFTADGTGLDRVLDSLSITITRASATTTNIEVAIKQKAADGIQPKTVQFSNTTATVTPLPAVTKTDLVPSGTASLIADLMTRITACYALPVAERVNVPDAVTATASAIKAASCKSIFNNNDPATYKNDGILVGKGIKTASAFSTIYTTDGNNKAFDRGTYQFTRANGDLVIGLRTTDKTGNVENGSVVVRLSAADNKLRLIGNQYDYSGSVVPYQQLREFINQPAATYYSTGYDLRVPNNGLFSKVIVTPPSGEAIILVPDSGSANLVIQKNGSPSSTSFLRIRSVYANTSNNGDPANAEPGLVSVSPRFSEADVAGIQQQSSWKFDYYLTGNITATPDATQFYKTGARALTIAELKTQPLANLTDTVITEVRAGSSATGNFPLNFTGPVQPDWTVPTGALAPTSIKIFGKGPSVNSIRQSFDDSANVSPTQRTGMIFCTSQSQSDNHCTTTNGVTNYASGSFVNGIHLFMRDTALREYAHHYATYSVTIP